MPKAIVPITDVDKDLLSQLEYALAFVSEEVTSYKINKENLRIEAELNSEEANPSVTAKIEELVARYQLLDFRSHRRICFFAIQFRFDSQVLFVDLIGGNLLGNECQSILQLRQEVLIHIRYGNNCLWHTIFLPSAAWR